MKYLVIGYCVIMVFGFAESMSRPKDTRTPEQLDAQAWCVTHYTDDQSLKLCLKDAVK